MNKVDKGKTVDELVNSRDMSEYNLFKAKVDLINMGVKTFNQGDVEYLPGLDVQTFIDWNNQEFSWEVEYDDGKGIRQFDKKDKPRHYGHIDQESLKSFRWISCFDYPTSNPIKKVIVQLNMQDLTFEFTNGMVDMDLKNKIWDMKEAYAKAKVSDKPKLIMKAVKRQMSTMPVSGGDAKRVAFYNRYLIGYETMVDGKKLKLVVCIEPNGEIHEWHEE